MWRLSNFATAWPVGAFRGWWMKKPTPEISCFAVLFRAAKSCLFVIVLWFVMWINKKTIFRWSWSLVRKSNIAVPVCNGLGRDTILRRFFGWRRFRPPASLLICNGCALVQYTFFIAIRWSNSHFSMPIVLVVFSVLESPMHMIVLIWLKLGYMRP